MRLDRTKHDPELEPAGGSYDGVLITIALVLGLVLGLVLAFTGCDKSKHPRGAAFAAGVEDCTLTLADVAGDVVAEAVASAQGAAGAPSWATFSAGELLTRGVAFGVCVVDKALAAIDLKLPAAPVDGAGQVQTMKLQAPEARGFYSPAATVPIDVAAALTAHARLVDFLQAHDRTHAHVGVKP